MTKTKKTSKKQPSIQLADLVPKGPVKGRGTRPSVFGLAPVQTDNSQTDTSKQ